ncbi:hypothetical protein Bca52824_076915 [Brassica carinata]|uniref:Uncharacterized protein n=1 Tax=Brassica carinata TaxID=52824 RepID=A0A8X7PT55_BRACI|nr:hypothetical protein Bca52824_076915 [Brassica carinata]
MLHFPSRQNDAQATEKIQHPSSSATVAFFTARRNRSEMLSLAPRSYHLSLSWVSKNLRSLVRSPELNSLRSIRHKSSLYVCFRKGYNDPNVHWFTLRPTEETATTTTEYRLVPNPTPFPHPKYGSSTVVVGSKIFFIGGSTEPSTDLWILCTRSGNMTQGPSMSVPREKGDMENVRKTSRCSASVERSWSMD